MRKLRREQGLRRTKRPPAGHGGEQFALGSPGNSARVYHAARWRFQRERLSGKAFEGCGGRSRIDNLLALEQCSVRICFCSVASYSGTRPRYPPPQALHGGGIPSLENRETSGTSEPANSRRNSQRGCWRRYGSTVGAWIGHYDCV